MLRTRSGSAAGARVRLLTCGAVLALSLGAAVAPARAGTTIPSIPRTNPADFTPRVVDDGTVTEAGLRELHQVGSTMYAGGRFRTVLNAARTQTYIRNNIFAFNATTGAVSTTFTPSANGAVYAMESSADGRFLYVGGDFGSFGGATVNNLVKYDLVNRRVDTSFSFPVPTGRVSDLEIVGSRLFVAGNFTGGIVAVSPTTGARQGYLDGVRVAGSESRWSTRVYRFSVNPASTRMVVIGSFTSVGGQARQQAAMVNLGATAATVSPWYSSRWNEGCFDSLQWYTRDVDWTPDGTRFAIVTTGGGFPGDPRRLCDTATLWRAVDQGGQEPVWINYSGGDTFHSVAVTNLGVFASGHFRWLDNPQGRDFAGPGAVSRLGIGAMDLNTGRALPWNPGKSVEGGLGGFDLLFTSAGLWVAHFEVFLGRGADGSRERHEGVGLLPY